MFENADQMVCLQIVSGMLDVGFTVDVLITTAQGVGPVMSVTLGETGWFNSSDIDIMTPLLYNIYSCPSHSKYNSSTNSSKCCKWRL